MMWIELIICGALITWADALLSKYGDVIADKTGWGRAWISAILITGVTSLPELASGVSAVAWLKRAKPRCRICTWKLPFSTWHSSP